MQKTVPKFFIVGTKSKKEGGRGGFIVNDLSQKGDIKLLWKKEWPENRQLGPFLCLYPCIYLLIWHYLCYVTLACLQLQCLPTVALLALKKIFSDKRWYLLFIFCDAENLSLEKFILEKIESYFHFEFFYNCFDFIDF